jgi:hypothetical protein
MTKNNKQISQNKQTSKEVTAAIKALEKEPNNNTVPKKGISVSVSKSDKSEDSNVQSNNALKYFKYFLIGFSIILLLMIGLGLIGKYIEHRNTISEQQEIIKIIKYSDVESLNNEQLDLVLYSEINPKDNLTGAQIQAEAYAQKMQYANAQNKYKQILNVKNDDPNLWVSYAMVNAYSGDMNGSKLALDKALSLIGDNDPRQTSRIKAKINGIINDK